MHACRAPPREAAGTPRVAAARGVPLNPDPRTLAGMYGYPPPYGMPGPGMPGGAPGMGMDPAQMMAQYSAQYSAMQQMAAAGARAAPRPDWLAAWGVCRLLARWGAVPAAGGGRRCGSSQLCSLSRWARAVCGLD